MTQSVTPDGDPAWTVIGAAGAPAFQNSWAAFGGLYGVPRFRKLGNGLVVLAGLASHSGASALVAFTLPAGYRPSAQMVLYSGDAAATTLILATGDVSSGSTAALIGLDGLCYFAEA